MSEFVKSRSKDDVNSTLVSGAELNRRIDNESFFFMIAKKVKQNVSHQVSNRIAAALNKFIC